MANGGWQQLERGEREIREVGSLGILSHVVRSAHGPVAYRYVPVWVPCKMIGQVISRGSACTSSPKL